MGKLVGFYLKMDEDIVKGLRRLKKVFGFPIASMVSEGLRPFVNTYLPLADLYEQGKLTQTELLQAFIQGLKTMNLDLEFLKEEARHEVVKTKSELKGSIKPKKK